MSYNNVKIKHGLWEDFDLDFSAAETGEKGYPKLMLVDKDSQGGESRPP